MTSQTTFGSFFLPGPTEVRPEVLEAMTRPMIPHRGKAFEAMFARLQEGLRDVFRTTRPVFISSSSATGLMEAAIRCAPSRSGSTSAATTPASTTGRRWRRSGERHRWWASSR